MAKVVSPLFFGIRGKIGSLCFRIRKNAVIELSKNRIPANPRTDAQLAQRDKYRNCVKQWNSLTEDERQQYEEQAKPLGLSGYHVFMAECLKKEEAPPTETLNGYELKITETWES